MVYPIKDREFINMLSNASQDEFQSYLMELLLSFSKEAGFEIVLREQYEPLITGFGLLNPGFHITVLDSFKITSMNSNHQFNIVIFESKNELFSYCETLSELILAYEAFNRFIKNIVCFLCGETMGNDIIEREHLLDTSYITSHKELYDDCVKLDENTFFSIDSEEDLKLYLPKYDVCILTSPAMDPYEVVFNKKRDIIEKPLKAFESYLFDTVPTLEFELTEYKHFNISHLENYLSNFQFRNLYNSDSSYDIHKYYKVFDVNKKALVENDREFVVTWLTNKQLPTESSKYSFKRAANGRFFVTSKEKNENVIYRGKSILDIMEFIYDINQ